MILEISIFEFQSSTTSKKGGSYYEAFVTSSSQASRGPYGLLARLAASL